MLSQIKLLVLLLIPCFVISCSFSQNGKKKKIDLSQEQKDALDALTTLQINTDELNRIYSTYPRINQPCYPADTSFEISQSEFAVYMKQFISKHCKNLSPEDQNKLAKLAPLAQEKYTVLHCADGKSNINYDEGYTMIGTWILPDILGQRDLLIVW